MQHSELSFVNPEALLINDTWRIEVKWSSRKSHSVIDPEGDWDTLEEIRLCRGDSGRFRSSRKGNAAQVWKDGRMQTWKDGMWLTLTVFFSPLRCSHLDFLGSVSTAWLTGGELMGDAMEVVAQRPGLSFRLCICISLLISPGSVTPSRENNPVLATARRTSRP